MQVETKRHADRQVDSHTVKSTDRQTNPPRALSPSPRQGALLNVFWLHRRLLPPRYTAHVCILHVWSRWFMMHSVTRLSSLVSSEETIGGMWMCLSTFALQTTASVWRDGACMTVTFLTAAKRCWDGSLWAATEINPSLYIYLLVSIWMGMCISLIFQLSGFLFFFN